MSTTPPTPPGPEPREGRNWDGVPVAPPGLGARPVTDAPIAKRGLKHKFGPGLLISASFIGPGTVTTATVTGASYGYALCWAIVFSVIATIVLQEMSARLGLATRQGLGEALRAVFHSTVARGIMVVLVVAAIGIGGAAYAGGDTTGTALAISSVTGLPQNLVVVIVIAIILVLLGTGSYKAIEGALTVLVFTLALIFVVTAIMVGPNLLDLLKGMFVPTIPDGALLRTVALIGTTVVPYNLFLHANLVAEKWEHVETPTAIREARTDTALSISVGGFITLAIITTATGAMFVHGIQAESGADLARALEPLLGETLAQWAFAIGLFAAGLTSAVAGPLGAAYAITGTIGLRNELKGTAFRIIWIGVVIVGAVLALTGYNPITIIVVAQAANGLLLPIIAGFLLVTMNNRKLLGDYRNGPLANVLGGAIFLVVTGLAVYQLADLAGLLG